MKARYKRRRFGFFPIAILMAVAAFTGMVYWLWNHVLVAVVPVKPVTFWQAMGLLALSRILFGSFKFGPGGGYSHEARERWREKWKQMNDDERSRFKQEWRRRAGFQARNTDE